MSYRNHIDFAQLRGMTFASVDVDRENAKIVFTTKDGRVITMCHTQDCCEEVEINDIVGDVSDLVGEPILLAEEVVHEGENPSCVTVPVIQDSFTWTFYKLATRKGYVDIRWYGESNGFYSERVDLIEYVHCNGGDK